MWSRYQSRYGCRVVQRAIEFCVEHQKDAVLKKIVECHASLVDDQYGNYVIQQSLVCGREEHQREVIKTLIKNDGSFVRLSKHKYASNVVEGMLKNGTDQHRVLILEELLKPSISNKNTGPCCAIELALDPIANYVVKSALECTKNGAQVEKLTEALNAHRMELCRSPFAKYVVARSPFAKYVVAKLNTKRDTQYIDPETSKQVLDTGEGNF